MKYNYSFERIKTNWDIEILTICLPKEIDAAASFITNISKDMGKWYIEGFNDVLSGKEEKQERDQEFLGCLIKKDLTKIYDMTGGNIESCEIETIELKNLIEIWLDELAEFSIK